MVKLNNIKKVSLEKQPTADAIPVVIHLLLKS